MPTTTTEGGTHREPGLGHGRRGVRHVGLVAVAAAALLLAGCDLLDVLPGETDEPGTVDPNGEPDRSAASASSGADEAKDDVAAGDATRTDDGDEHGEVVESPPRIVPPGADVGIELRTPEAGEGPWPRLTWEPVPGATQYTVTLYAATGRAAWTWQGEASEVLVGSFAQRPAPDSPIGPRVHEPMSWDVLARDADGRIIAVSGERPIRP